MKLPHSEMAHQGKLPGRAANNRLSGAALFTPVNTRNTTRQRRHTQGLSVSC